jgi:hypothetical protein
MIKSLFKPIASIPTAPKIPTKESQMATQTPCNIQKSATKYVNLIKRPFLLTLPVSTTFHIKCQLALLSFAVGILSGNEYILHYGTTENSTGGDLVRSNFGDYGKELIRGGDII